MDPVTKYEWEFNRKGEFAFIIARFELISVK